MQEGNKPAQILLIFVIALAILSIFVVVIAVNVRRDSVETAQNEQYEAFYSLSEDKLLKLIAEEPLTECTPVGTTGTSFNCNVVYEGTTLLIALNSVKTNSFEDFPLEKDKTLKIGLDDGDDGYRGDINFKDDPSHVADWMITIDYIDAKGFYAVSKNVVARNGVYASSPANDCIFYQAEYIRFNIDECLRSAAPSGVTKVLAVRMKPLTASGGVNLSLYGDADLPLQMQIVTATSNVSSQSAVEGNTPRIVLEMMQPLFESPIEILDYVVRNDNEVDK